MKKRISIEEIEEIIKSKLKQNGVLEMINQDKISEIKNKIKDILDKNKKSDLEEQETEKTTTQNTPVQTSNPNVTVKTSEDPEKTEIIKKETELEKLETDLIKKEIELEEKEKELEEKENELSYKPELPQILKSIKPGEIIIFDTNELSLGFENLSHRKFRIKSNPDDKKTINDLWIQSAITQTDVYAVQLKKIGSLNFNPYDGTTTFENISQIEELPKLDDSFEENNRINSAIDSQKPKEEMIDSILPIKDVSQPILNINDLEKEKFETNFKDVIQKIVSDELNKISSQTTKQNIFSL